MSQGIEVYAIDNWSTDGTWELLHSVRAQLRGIERFPKAVPPTYYHWSHLLARIEKLAADSPETWCMRCDPDEIRRSPRAGETLLEGLRRVDSEGYTGVDFDVFTFRPVDDSYVMDPERHFRYYEQDATEAGLPHISAWKNLGPVDLALSGGHMAIFPESIKRTSPTALQVEANVSPEKFILKHYPIRTVRQAEAKLADRFARWDPVERKAGWHQQYDELLKSRKFIGQPEELKCWDSPELFWTIR
jgi:hypothetical protein